MSDPWIKMRKKLANDPRVIVAAKRCDIRPNEIIGGLFQLWCMADDHGGHLSAFDADTLDELVRIPGFTNALPSDWIVVSEAGIDLPNYDEHNGSTAKRRASEAKRKADARKVSASDADKKRTRGDKRRGEDKEKPPPPAWARELANDIAKNKADRFSQATTPKQIEDWAHKLALLTRSKAFTTPPTAEIVAEVIRWGIADDGDGEKWVGWGQQIRSAPSADKFTTIKASKDRARQQPREHGWYD